MNPADEEPARPRVLLASPVLDSLGVAELEAYIAALQGEIARVRAAIAARDAHRAAASALFRRL